MELIIYLNLTLPVLDVQIVTEECHFRLLLLCFISRGRSLLRASHTVLLSLFTGGLNLPNSSKKTEKYKNYEEENRLRTDYSLLFKDFTNRLRETLGKRGTNCLAHDKIR